MSSTTFRPWTAIYPCDVTTAGKAEHKTIADAAARDLLWSLSGRRFGVADTIGETFVVTDCESSSGYPWEPYVLDGEWYNARCGGDCVVIQLRNQPIRTVTELRINGAVATAWRLDGSTITLDAAVCPVCSDCAQAPLSIDYTWGIDVPALGSAAFGELSCEFMAALTGGACRLSSRAQSITRQGVTIDMFDATELATLGLTGLPIVDAFIRSVNPSRLQQRSRVFSPDMPRNRG